jgi:hypothetical protein
MNPEYHQRLADASERQLRNVITASNWSGVVVEREGDHFFMELPGKNPLDRYVAHVDMSGYPVQPYHVGFFSPAASLADRYRVSDRDPRFWPWSPVPGFQGSFNITRAGPIPVFWCRPCTSAYFAYHPQDAWLPYLWPLDRVVAELREAVQLAFHPSRWRPVERLQLLAIAQQLNVPLPDLAGIDDG